MVPSPRQGPAAIAFFDELRRNGFIEGQNLAVVPDGFDADYGHLPELVAALVKAAPDAIIAGPARALQALQSVTHNIPLIGMTEDMVAEGVVPSFAHPGGNITGVSLLSPELDTQSRSCICLGVTVKGVETFALTPWYPATLLPDVTTILIHVRFRGQSGHRRSRPSRPLMTQNRHREIAGKGKMPFY